MSTRFRCEALGLSASTSVDARRFLPQRKKKEKQRKERLRSKERRDKSIPSFELSYSSFSFRFSHPAAYVCSPRFSSSMARASDSRGKQKGDNF